MAAGCLALRAEPLEVRRRYRPGTLILETEFRTTTTAVVIDFMPPADGVSDLVRIVYGLSGKVRFQTELALRFDYGSTVPWVTRNDDGTIEAIAGPERIVLRTSAGRHQAAEHEIIASPTRTWRGLPPQSKARRPRQPATRHTISGLPLEPDRSLASWTTACAVTAQTSQRQFKRHFRPEGATSEGVDVPSWT
jgi:hypothetical protein